MNVTGIEIDGRLYDFAQMAGDMWDACEKCAFNNKPGSLCAGHCPCIAHDQQYGGNSFLRARGAKGGSHGKPEGGDNGVQSAS